MYSEDKSMTAIIQELLKRGLIVISTCLKTGAFIPVLSRTGWAVGQIVSSLIDEITSGMNWDALCNASNWREVVVTVFGIAKDWVVKNVELMIYLALRIARFIENLFKSGQSYNSNSSLKALPAQEYKSKMY